MDYLSNPLVITAAKSIANQQNVALNRARAAVMVDMGYGALDAYTENRSLLFILGLIGSCASGYMLYKRKGAEARALYSISLVASAGLAWFTRPDALRSAPPAPAPGEPEPATPAESTTRRSLAWLDQKAADNTAEDPNWENAAWSRLSQDLGSGTIPPAVTALLIR